MAAAPLVVLMLLVLAQANARVRSGCDAVIVSSERSPMPEGQGNINSRSLSPWTWKSSRVEGRVPQTLWEAQCQSSSCLQGAALNAVPIYQRILVLNRRAADKCYSASYLSVAVGCTCVRAQTS